VDRGPVVLPVSQRSGEWRAQAIGAGCAVRVGFSERRSSDERSYGKEKPGGRSGAGCGVEQSGNEGLYLAAGVVRCWFMCALVQRHGVEGGGQGGSCRRGREARIAQLRGLRKISVRLAEFLWYDFQI